MSIQEKVSLEAKLKLINENLAMKDIQLKEINKLIALTESENNKIIT